MGECAILAPGGTLINILTIVTLTTILTTINLKDNLDTYGNLDIKSQIVMIIYVQFLSGLGSSYPLAATYTGLTTILTLMATMQVGIYCSSLPTGLGGNGDFERKFEEI